MKTHEEEKRENRSRSIANEVSGKQAHHNPLSPFTDNRPQAGLQRKLQTEANSGKRPQTQVVQRMYAINEQQGDQVVQSNFASGNGTTYDVYSVRANDGSRTHALAPNGIGHQIKGWFSSKIGWGPDNRYFCHGYSLGTWFALGYSVGSGGDLFQALWGDGFSRKATWPVKDDLSGLEEVGGSRFSPPKPGDIVVLSGATPGFHSGVIASLDQTNPMDSTRWRIDHKVGAGALKHSQTIAEVFQDYAASKPTSISLWGGSTIEHLDDRPNAVDKDVERD